MKKIVKYIAAIVLVLAFGSCAKDGADGPIGPEGRPGVEGRPGERGEQGIQGKQGIPGMDGKMIHYGDTPPSASIGNQGDFYIDKKNSNLYGPKTTTGWGAASSMKGADGKDGINGAKGDKGEAGNDGRDGEKGDKGDKGEKGDTGTAGSQFLSGTTDPASALGKAGDFYFNGTTGTLFGPKTSTWPTGVNLKGPKGDKGDKGDKGEDGKDGNANVETMGWTTVTKQFWYETTAAGVNTDGSVRVLSPGDYDLRYVQHIFVSNQDLTGAVLVYADNGKGIRMLPYDDRINNGYGTNEANIQVRHVYKDKQIYIIVALRSETGWNAAYITDTYLPSLKWKIVIIPELIAKAQADAISKLNLTHYKVVSAYFDLEN